MSMVISAAILSELDNMMTFINSTHSQVLLSSLLYSQDGVWRGFMRLIEFLMLKGAFR